MAIIFKFTFSLLCFMFPLGNIHLSLFRKLSDVPFIMNDNNIENENKNGNRFQEDIKSESINQKGIFKSVFKTFCKK